MSLYETSLLIALTSTTIGIVIVIVKFLYCFISMRFNLKYKDYMSRPQLEEVITKVIASSGLVTYAGLTDFCKKSQLGCPKNTDLTEVTLASKSLAESMKIALAEQKTLRQQTLPKEYIDRTYFKETIERIEKTSAAGISEIKNLVGVIQIQITNIASHAFQRRQFIKGQDKELKEYDENTNTEVTG